MMALVCTVAAWRAYGTPCCSTSDHQINCTCSVTMMIAYRVILYNSTAVQYVTCRIQVTRQKNPKDQHKQSGKPRQAKSGLAYKPGHWHQTHPRQLHYLHMWIVTPAIDKQQISQVAGSAEEQLAGVQRPGPLTPYMSTRPYYSPQHLPVLALPEAAAAADDH